jgi:hypothetical protein
VRYGIEIDYIHLETSAALVEFDALLLGGKVKKGTIWLGKI